MKIGKLAALTGLTPSAIRFYEQSGLLPAAGRGANGYRIYDETSAQRLRQIQLAQRLGFTLEEMRSVAEDMRALSKDSLLARLDQRLHEVDELRAMLDQQRTELHSLRETLQSEWAAGRCLQIDQCEPSTSAVVEKHRPPVRTTRDFDGRKKRASGH